MEATIEELKEWEEKIKTMTQYEMAYLWRFAPAGHPLFCSSYDLFEQLNERFTELGGMTVEISKMLDKEKHGEIGVKYDQYLYRWSV